MDEGAIAIVEIGSVLLLAAGLGWAARRVGLPAVVGYLAAGLAVSPFTPGFVADRTQIQLLADVGVVLLLFEVGIEIDPRRLRREHGGLIWAAPLQTIVTALLAGVAAYALGLPPLAAATVGLAVALSSSVVIVNITRSRRRTTDRDTEQALLGWSVLQDVTGVALAAALLALSGGEARPPAAALLGLLGFVAVAVAVAWLLPRVLLRLRSEHDLFLIVSVATGLAVAGLGAVAFGVPMALAAFVAGLAISESPDAAEARRRMLPFRDLFAVLFFVAIGSLIDPARLGGALPWVALLLALIVVGKVAVAYLLARAARLPARPLQLAIGLSQIGEFSFVLASIGLERGHLPADVYTALLATVALSIALSTVLVRLVGPARPPEPPQEEARAVEPGPR
ncbi:MAG TPA: cation:proton antiporter [Candidatus Limnocylindrales bacterium]|nr:cation:proton antiporter [Candidatus Limnocylindrales bacterium]